MSYLVTWMPSRACVGALVTVARHLQTLNFFAVCEVFIKFLLWKISNIQVETIVWWNCLVYSTHILLFLWSIFKQLRDNFVSFNLLIAKWVSLFLHVYHLWSHSTKRTVSLQCHLMPSPCSLFLQHLKLFCGQWLACLNQEPITDNTLHLVNNVF